MESQVVWSAGQFKDCRVDTGSIYCNPTVQVAPTKGSGQPGVPAYVALAIVIAVALLVGILIGRGSRAR